MPLLFPALVLGCAPLYGLPSKTETDGAFTRMEQLTPGSSEERITLLFPRVTPQTTGRYGIIDTSEHISDGYVSRTFWIGYYYVGPGGYSIDEKRVVCYTTINGVIDSAFFP